ncbi:glycosyltransferase family 61 protein [Mucilaginibacter sp. UYCu711]|uniref:glycosyltransferase family 61 protein n=1 Tax=Mucilaginibacter sp. UYCu711 TaxID=3156339 RepID=UPI003D1F5FF5
MNTDELKKYLQTLHIDMQDNDNALKFLTAKPYTNFYLTTAGVGFKRLSLIKELLFGSYQLGFFRLYALKHFLFSKKVKLEDEKYLIIHNFWSQGYHHWLAEALLKLIVFNANYSEYTLLLPASYSAFAKQSLDKFKFKDIVYLEEQCIYHIPNGVVINNPKSGFFYDEHIKQLKDFYLSTSSNPFRKIYISRRNETLRRIVNEKDIYPLLIENGYEIIEPQLLSFQEQVTLFSEAVEIIAIHGAALTNIVFMQQGARVVELYREVTANDLINGCYYRLAQAAKLKYEMCFLKIGNKHKDIDRSDLIISKNEFALLLTSNNN